MRDFQAIVLAATVTDDDFAVICYQVKAKQPGQALLKVVSLVQNRDDYAELYSISRRFR